MSTTISIIRAPITRADVQRAAEQSFGDFVKVVVDLGRNIMAMGGELHADIEEVFLADGSEQKNLWGINLYPARADAGWIEFDSMINIRPSQGNRSRDVEDPAIQERIRHLVVILVTQ